MNVSTWARQQAGMIMFTGGGRDLPGRRSLWRLLIWPLRDRQITRPDITFKPLASTGNWWLVTGTEANIVVWRLQCKVSLFCCHWHSVFVWHCCWQVWEVSPEWCNVVSLSQCAPHGQLDSLCGDSTFNTHCSGGYKATAHPPPDNNTAPGPGMVNWVNYNYFKPSWTNRNPIKWNGGPNF